MRYKTVSPAIPVLWDLHRIFPRKKSIRRWMMTDINVGDKAPDFSLPVTLEEKMTLSEVLEEKKVVLAFYIFDFAGDLKGL